MKARVRIELPPGVGDTPDVRARVVKQVAARLNVDAHVGCGPDCEHDLEKSEKPMPKLRHRAPQAGIDRAAKLYETMMARMVEDIAAALRE